MRNLLKIGFFVLSMMYLHGCVFSSENQQPNIFLVDELVQLAHEDVKLDGTFVVVGYADITPQGPPLTITSVPVHWDDDFDFPSLAAYSIKSTDENNAVVDTVMATASSCVVVHGNSLVAIKGPNNYNPLSEARISIDKIFLCEEVIALPVKNRREALSRQCNRFTRFEKKCEQYNYNSEKPDESND